MCVRFSRRFLTSFLSFELEGLLLASCIFSLKLLVLALHLSRPMHRYLRVTNQMAVLPTQAPKEDHSEHRRLILSATSPLAVKPRFQDLDMVRFLVLYIGDAETAALYYHHQFTTASIRPPAELK
jgi:hypothetical protein